MDQQIIVYIIGAIVFIYAAVKIYRSLSGKKRKSNCGCTGCSGCDAMHNNEHHQCDDSKK